ncbi:MAG: hypothetical protein AAGJ34_06390 [Pseudomonadota bacterium]
MRIFVFLIGFASSLALGGMAMADGPRKEYFITDLNMMITEDVKQEVSSRMILDFQAALDREFRRSVLPVFSGDRQALLNITLTELAVDEGQADWAGARIVLKDAFSGRTIYEVRVDGTDASNRGRTDLYRVLAQQLAAATRATMR